MKKTIWLVAGLVMVLLFAVSCGGVSQEAYDKATGDLAAKTAELKNSTDDLTAKTAELQALNTKYDQTNSDLAAVNTKLTKAKNEIAILNAIFLPAITGEMEQMSDAEGEKLLQEIEANVNTIGDAVLTKKYNAMKDSNGDADTTMDFFVYLLQDMEKTLE